MKYSLVSYLGPIFVGVDEWFARVREAYVETKLIRRRDARAGFTLRTCELKPENLQKTPTKKQSLEIA